MSGEENGESSRRYRTVSQRPRVSIQARGFPEQTGKAQVMGSTDDPVQDGRWPEGCSQGFSEMDLLVLSMSLNTRFPPSPM